MLSFDNLLMRKALQAVELGFEANSSSFHPQSTRIAFASQVPNYTTVAVSTGLHLYYARVGLAWAICHAIPTQFFRTKKLFTMAVQELEQMSNHSSSDFLPPAGETVPPIVVNPGGSCRCPHPANGRTATLPAERRSNQWRMNRVDITACELAAARTEPSAR
jgi:hypothetical protein